MKERLVIPELMDDLALERNKHFKALQGLQRINGWSQSVRTVWLPIERLLRENPGKRYHILDVATGAGDLPIGLWKKSQKMKVALDISACDKSIQALEYAKVRAKNASAPIHFFELDVLKNSIPKHYDIILCSLFFHHLNSEEAKEVLQKMSQAARSMVLVVDLRRNLSHWILSCLATRVLSRSEVVHTDGPRSVRAAFTTDEFHSLCQSAGLNRTNISNRWPYRFLMEWKAP